MRQRLEHIGNSDIKRAIRDIQNVWDTTATLDLSRNSLDMKDGFNLIEILKYLKPALRSINMRGNGFFDLSPESFKTILTSIPPHVVKLDLSYNDFKSRDPDEFLISLATLPKTVNKLDLIGNNLPESTIIRIAKAFSDREIFINVGLDDDHACMIDNDCMIVENYMITTSSMIFNGGKQKLSQRISFFKPVESSDMDEDVPRNTMAM